MSSPSDLVSCPLCGKALGRVDGIYGVCLPGPVVLQVHPECYLEKSLGASGVAKSMTKATCRNCGQALAVWHQGKDVTIRYTHGTDGRCWSPAFDGSVLPSFLAL